jgi:hypothetical protein
MEGGTGRDRFCVLGRSLPPELEIRMVAIAPGGTRTYAEVEWSDALVVIEHGEIELESVGGTCLSFRLAGTSCGWPGSNFGLFTTAAPNPL